MILSFFLTRNELHIGISSLYFYFSIIIPNKMVIVNIYYNKLKYNLYFFAYIADDMLDLHVSIWNQSAKKRGRAAQHSNEHNRRQNLYRNRKPLLSLSFYFSFSPYPNAMTASCHITVSTNNQSILLNHSRRGKSIPGYESDRKTRAGCSPPVPAREFIRIHAKRAPFHSSIKIIFV